MSGPGEMLPSVDAPGVFLGADSAVDAPLLKPRCLGCGVRGAGHAVDDVRRSECREPALISGPFIWVTIRERIVAKAAQDKPGVSEAWNV